MSTFNNSTFTNAAQAAPNFAQTAPSFNSANFAQTASSFAQMPPTTQNFANANFAQVSTASGNSTGRKTRTGATQIKSSVQVVGITSKTGVTDPTEQAMLESFKQNPVVVSNYDIPLDYIEKIRMGLEPKSQLSLIRFDNTLLTVRKYSYENNTYKWCVSIQDLKDNYADINDKFITQFKNKFRNTVAQAQQYPTVEATAEVDPKSVPFNNSNVTLTESSNEYLSIDYLIPFLMETSPSFNRRTSKFMFNIMSAYPYNATYAPENINTQIMNEFTTFQKPSVTSLNPYSKPKPTAQAKPKPTAKAEGNKKIMVYQQGKYIIPRPLNNNGIEIINICGLTQAYNSGQQDPDVNKYIKLYGLVNAKNFNKADIAVVDKIVKNGIIHRLSFLSNAQIAEKQTSADVYTQNMQGVVVKKSKTKAGETVDVSQPAYDFNDSYTVPDYVTAQKLYEYITSNGGFGININLPEQKQDATAAPKVTKFDISSQDDAAKIVEIANSQEFITFINSTKATKGGRGKNAGSIAQAAAAPIPGSFQTQQAPQIQPVQNFVGVQSFPSAGGFGMPKGNDQIPVIPAMDNNTTFDI